MIVPTILRLKIDRFRGIKMVDWQPCVRIFGDPMQHIYKDDAALGVSPPCDWDTLVGQANATAISIRRTVGPMVALPLAAGR